MPEKTAPEVYGTDENSGTPEKTYADHHAWIPEPGRITYGVPPGTINPARVVGRNINDVRTGRLYGNITILDNHVLIFRRLEISLLLRPLAQLLDRVHHLILLAQEGVSHVGGFLEFFIHHGKNLRKMAERFHTYVPWFILKSRIES